MDIQLPEAQYRNTDMERKTTNISGSCTELNHNFKSTTPERVKPNKLTHIYLCTRQVAS